MLTFLLRKPSITPVYRTLYPSIKIKNIFAQTLHSAKAIKSSVSDTITEWNSQVLIYVIGNITSFYGFFV